MSIYSNVTKQGSNHIREIAEQQKNVRAKTFKNTNLKQTLDINLSESLSPITRKVDTVNESANNLGEIFTISDSEKETL